MKTSTPTKPRPVVAPNERPSPSDRDRRSRLHVAWLLALVLGVMAGGAIEARADSGSLVADPTVVAGLTITVDTRWIAAGGYRPVKITVTPVGPVIADRTLMAEFLFHPGPPNQYVRRIVQDIEIPAGSVKPIEATMAIPEEAAWPGYTVHFVEDRRSLKWRHMGSFTTTGVMGPESLPGVLIVSDSAADTSGLAAAMPIPDTSSQPAYYPPAKAPAKPKAKPTLPTAIVRSVPELPQRWIEYTNCDIICLSLDELHRVGRQNPRAFQAILAWTSAGGNLLVYGVRDDWIWLAELESLLRLPSKPGVKGGPSARGWSEPDKSAFGRPIVLPQRVYGMATVQRANASPAATAPKMPPFLMRECDLGMVVAVASDAPFPGDERVWNWLLNSLDANRWLWSQRHGLSTVSPNPEFWQFQIPGVGLPPVNAFRVLITLFVLAIGPLNYWLLRRRRKLQLLVVTIPVAASVVTLALFGYALLADGLGTRVRVRSATVLDQGRGRAACWARLSYYSGLTPSGGLSFPADVAVIPFDYVPGDPSSGRQEMLWTDAQHMTSGWVPARTPTQLLTVRSRPSDARLDVARPNDKAEGLDITNRLGVRIAHLAVCAEDGKCYAVDGLDAGATVRAQAAEGMAPAMAALGKVYQANKLEYPAGMDASRLQLYSYRRRYGRYWYGPGSGTTSTQQTGRLEQAMATINLTAALARPLAPRSYLAIVETSPEVVLGTPQAREEASFHVILGRW